MARLRNPKTDGMEDLRDFEPDDDESGRRLYDTQGYNFLIRSYNPFGLFKISTTKGTLPSELSGSYTSVDEAQSAIDAFVRSNKKE